MMERNLVHSEVLRCLDKGTWSLYVRNLIGRSKENGNILGHFCLIWSTKSVVQGRLGLNIY